MNHPADAARLTRRRRPPEAVQQLSEAAEWLAQLDQAVTDADADRCLWDLPEDAPTDAPGGLPAPRIVCTTTNAAPV